MRTVTFDEKLIKLATIIATDSINIAYNAVDCGFGGSPPPARHVWDAMLSAIPENLLGVVEHRGKPELFDVRCNACNGTGLDNQDDNYGCEQCAGDGYVATELYTHPPARIVEVQAQQLRFALNSLHRISKGEPSPDNHARIAINHITCGTYDPTIDQPGSKE